MFILRDREERMSGGGADRESQAGSVLSVQSLMWGSNSQTVRSRHEPRPRVGCFNRLRHLPRLPRSFWMCLLHQQWARNGPKSAGRTSPGALRQACRGWGSLQGFPKMVVKFCRVVKYGKAILVAFRHLQFYLNTHCMASSIIFRTPVMTFWVPESLWIVSTTWVYWGSYKQSTSQIYLLQCTGILKKKEKSPTISSITL